jgi:hypothetical protein
MENTEGTTLHIFRSYKLQASGVALHVARYSFDIGKASLQSSGTPSYLLRYISSEQAHDLLHHHCIEGQCDPAIDCEPELFLGHL